MMLRMQVQEVLFGRLSRSGIEKKYLFTGPLNLTPQEDDTTTMLSLLNSLKPSKIC